MDTHDVALVFQSEEKNKLKRVVDTLKALTEDLISRLNQELAVRHFLFRETREEIDKTANKKLMRECEVLQNRLQECNVKFHIEEESELIMESSSPSEAMGLLATSDNRIGLLIAGVGSTTYTSLRHKP